MLPFQLNLKRRTEANLGPPRMGRQYDLTSMKYDMLYGSGKCNTSWIGKLQVRKQPHLLWTHWAVLAYQGGLMF